MLEKALSLRKGKFRNRMNGIINVYKEKGYTSHDVVARLRGITGERHIGHTGTLDPAATGVLPMCLGSATKACELLTDKGKCYETVLMLGIETDTEDATGNLTNSGDVSNITDEMIIEAVNSFKGEISQVPPVFSATRINGQISYDLARKGITVDRNAKTVCINEITIISEIQRGKLKNKKDFKAFEEALLERFPEDEESEDGRWRWENNVLYSEENLDIDVIRVAIRIDCEKGTYIRTICSDIGRKLGCGGCMERLLRTRSGEFRVEDTYRLSDLEKIFCPKDSEADEKEIEKVLLSADKCFMEFPPLHIKEKYEDVLMNGNLLWMRHFKEYIDIPDRINRVYNSKNEFIALYEWIEKRKLYKPLKVFGTMRSSFEE